MVLVAHDTHGPIRVQHSPAPVATIVFDDLEFEPPRRLVVADDLEDIGLLLIPDEEAILEHETRAPGRSLGLGVHGHHCPRVREEVGPRRIPLERSVEG